MHTRSSAIQTDLLKDWPSPNKRPSPINRKLLAETRDAIIRGERGLKKEELIWGNDAAKKGN